MRDRSVRHLRDALLDAGVALKFVRRFEIEIEDHLSDLQREARRRGKAPAAAKAEALRRIGTRRAIALAFAEHPELKCWVFRSRLAHVAIRILVAIGLTCYRTTHGPVAKTVMRYAVAGASACVVTSALLVGLGAAVLSSRELLDFDSDKTAGTRMPLRTYTSPQRETQTIMRRPPLVADPEESLASRESTRTTISVGRFRPGNDSNGALARLARRGARPAGTAHADSTDPSSRVIRPELERAATYELEPPRLANIDAAAVAPKFGFADGEFLPIVKVSPVYPARAASRGIEGYVVVEYTVTRTGMVRDVVVIESSSPLFERSALDAAAKFKYKPRVIDGETVDVSGVRTIIRFKLEA